MKKTRNENAKLKSLNSEVLTGLSIEELEDRIEMQILGAMPTSASPNPTYQGVTYTTHIR